MSYRTDIDDILPNLSPKARESVLRQLGRTEKPKEAKENKYKAEKVEIDGHTFDSKKEARRYHELKTLMSVGQISDLKMQVPFVLIPKQRKSDGHIERECVYIADFVYQQNGKTVVEDVKGYRDPASAAYAKFVIKRKLMLERYGIEIKEV